MEHLAPQSDIRNDIERGEVRFAISGLWTFERMESFLRGLTKAAIPVVQQRLPIRVYGDMSGFVAQTRETGDAIRNHLIMSRQYGLERVAIVGASTLVKLQYKRLSDGIEVEFFDDRVEALRWLRVGETAA